MSINALTNAALARRTDFEPADTVPSSLKDIALAAGVTPKPTEPVAAGGAAGGGAATDGTHTALQTLTTYIPTEVLTLYVAAIATLGPLKINGQDVGRWLPFWFFLAATPFLVWAAFATKLVTAGKAIPVLPAKWPIWEMVAATIAYFAWTFALPSTPFSQYTDWYSSGLAGFLVLVVSAGLGIIAPLMQRKLHP